MRRPLMVALALRPWRDALRILWELREGPQVAFRALQSAVATQSSLLT